MPNNSNPNISNATGFIRRALGMNDAPKPPVENKPPISESPPTEVKTRKLNPAEGETTRIKSPQPQPKFDGSATQKMEGPQEPPSGWKQSPREDIKLFEEQSRAQEPVTRRMPRPDEKTAIRRKTPTPDVKKPTVPQTKSPKSSQPLSPDKTLRNVPREEIFNKKDLKLLEKVKKYGFQAAKTNWRKLIIGGIVGAVIVGGAFAVFEYAMDRAQEKIGSTDLSMFLPSTNKVVWLSAPFKRFDREKAPYFEPNVFEEKVTISNNHDDIYALGVSLQGLPESFVSDIDVNGTGEGKSDWLCAPTGGYLICASISGNPLMEKGKNTTVSLMFHLPAIELKKYLQTSSGSRQVYLIMPKK